MTESREPVPVNGEDYKAMYEALISVLARHGESGDYMSYVEKLYKAAQSHRLEPITEEEMLDCMFSESDLNKINIHMLNKIMEGIKLVCQRFGQSKLEPTVEEIQKILLINLPLRLIPPNTEGLYLKTAKAIHARFGSGGNGKMREALEAFAYNWDDPVRDFDRNEPFFVTKGEMFDLIKKAKEALEGR